MTVLNTPNDGSFNVLTVLVRATLALGRTSRDDLLAYCSAGLSEQPKRLGATLTRWTGLGLFYNEEGTIRLADGIDLPSDPQAAVAGLPAVLRRIVFREEHNARLWDSEGSMCADLTRGLAWLLAQDIYACDVSVHASLQALEARQLVEPERRIVQNDVRYGGLMAWGSCLGFLWNFGAPIIDPTTALREDLTAIFGDNTELAAADLQRRIAALLPVLDGGSYRRQVEEVLDPATWKRPSRPEILSTALSRALWRLEDIGVLVLERREDAGDDRVLQRSEGREWKRFTHAQLSRRAA